MTIIPVNLTGGTYRHKSLPVSAQTTRNFYPQLQDRENTKSPYILQAFPGKKLFGTGAGSSDRGMFVHLGILYKVTGTTLYSVNQAGTHTSLGTIPGAGRCIFDGIGTNVVISTEDIRYIWNGSIIATISDADLEAGNSNAHLNNKMIFDGLNGRFWVSDVGDATSIDSLNFASAESNADDLKRVYVYDQNLYLFGDKTIELWWDSGVGTPPFQRIQGGIIEKGLESPYAVDNTINFLYFLGDDFQMYAAKGAEIIPTLPHSVVREIKSYNIKSDAFINAYNLEEQWMIQITFPDANKTWCYPEGGEVFELSSGTQGGRDLANSYAFAFGKHLVGDAGSGNIFELDYDTYNENGNVVIRTRDSAPITAERILPQAAGRTVTMNSFELVLETGIGLLAGQGSDPQVMLSFSDDGGRTFSSEMWASVGESNSEGFQKKVSWHGLGTFRERIIRVRVSDPVAWSIHSAVMDVEIGI